MEDERRGRGSELIIIHPWVKDSVAKQRAISRMKFIVAVNVRVEAGQASRVESRREKRKRARIASRRNV